MTDFSQAVVAEYAYDAFGNTTKTAGSMDADFQYADYYVHAATGAHLTLYRAYDPGQGRWLSRDILPNAEVFQGANLYEYCESEPINSIDSLGLDTYVIREPGIWGHEYIGIGGSTPPGNSTYGGFPGGANLGDVFFSTMKISHPGESTKFVPCQDQVVAHFNTTPAQEKQLENWINANYDINGANNNEKNGYYIFPINTCRDFSINVQRELINIMGN